MTQEAHDRDSKAAPAGCIVGLLALVGVHVWWLSGGWPLKGWLKQFSVRSPIVFALLFLLYGGYLLHGSWRATRRYGPNAAARSERRWGVGLAGLGLLLVALEVTTRWLAR